MSDVAFHRFAERHPRLHQPAALLELLAAPVSSFSIVRNFAIEHPDKTAKHHTEERQYVADEVVEVRLAPEEQPQGRTQDERTNVAESNRGVTNNV